MNSSRHPTGWRLPLSETLPWEHISRSLDTVVAVSRLDRVTLFRIGNAFLEFCAAFEIIHNGVLRWRFALVYHTTETQKSPSQCIKISRIWLGGESAFILPHIPDCHF